jgi:hypothetical protein
VTIIQPGPDFTRLFTAFEHTAFRRLVVMHFGDQDKFQGGEVIEDPAVIVEHNYWRDAAQHHATDRKAFEAQVK